MRFGRDETPQLERARIVPPEERTREPAVRAILWWVLVSGLAYGRKLVGVARASEVRSGYVREDKMDVLFHLCEAAGADLDGCQLELQQLVYKFRQTYYRDELIQHV